MKPIVGCILVVLALLSAATAEANDRQEDSADDTSEALPPLSQEYFSEEQDGFVVSYHPAARERVRDVFSRLASIRDELGRAVGKPVLGHVVVRVAELPIEITQLAPTHEAGVVSHGGLSLPPQRLIIISLDGAERAGESFDASLRYHLAQLAILEGSLDISGESRVPPWFAEGFAVHFASTQRIARASELAEATWSGHPPSLSELAQVSIPDQRQRAFAADFARFTVSEDAMPALFGGLRDGLDFERAVESAFGSEPTNIDRAWRRDVTRRYAIFPTVALAAATLGTLLLLRGWRRRRNALRSRPPRSTARGARTARAARLGLRRRELAHREARLRIPIHLADHHKLPVVEHDGSWHTLH